MLSEIWLHGPSLWHPFRGTSCQWMKNKQALSCITCINSCSFRKGVCDLIFSSWGLVAGKLWLSLIFISTSIIHCLPIGFNKMITALYLISINYSLITWIKFSLSSFPVYSLRPLSLPSSWWVPVEIRNQFWFWYKFMVFDRDRFCPPRGHFWLSHWHLMIEARVAGNILQCTGKELLGPKCQ